MEVTGKIILDTRRSLKSPESTNHYPIKVRITFNRRSKLYSVLVDNERAACTEKEFDELMDISKQVRGKKLELRTGLIETQNKMLDLARSIHPFSFDDFEKAKDGVKRESWTLKDAFEDKIANVENYGTGIAYKNALSSLESFGLPKKASITKDYVRKWIKFMESGGVRSKEKESDKPAKPNSTTTIGMYLRCFKHIVTHYNLADEVIFGSKGDLIRMPNSKPKQGRKALTINDIRRIIKEPTQNETEQEAKDYWLFSYYASGMNIFDVLLLEWDRVNLEEKYLTYVRRKTSRTRKGDNTSIRVELIDPAIEIIKRRGVPGGKFVFEVLEGLPDHKTMYRKKNNLLSRMNKAIRAIGRRLNLDLKFLTSYGARHSYATVLKRAGEDESLISEQLGHTSVATTATYMGWHESEKVRNAAKKLL